LDLRSNPQSSTETAVSEEDSLPPEGRVNFSAELQHQHVSSHFRYSSNAHFDDASEIHESRGLQSPLPATPSRHAPGTSSFICNTCDESFSTPGALNRHDKKHSLPFKCPVPACKSKATGFRYNKDLDRHTKALHPETVPEADRFFCPHRHCKRSEMGDKFFPRRDAFLRHMKTHEKAGLHVG